MELGKGTWTNRDEDYAQLRQRFFDHLSRYDRILTLRRLAGSALVATWQHELVEIPKALLLQARDGRLGGMSGTKQQRSAPAYYRVEEPHEDYTAEKFSLYFDGGGERKLQIKGLDKRLCQVHATWRFDVETTGPTKEQP